MKLHILSSSSTGNSYALEDEQGYTLLIEAGCPLKKLVRFFDFEITKVDGLLISHEHGDHGKYAKEYSKAGIQLIASRGTLEAVLSEHRFKSCFSKPIASGTTHQYGHCIGADSRWKVKAFHIHHDAAEPTGFLICHKECGNVLFLTDTHYMDAKFKGLNQVIIEANYDEEILDKRLQEGSAHPAHLERVNTSHMSIQTTSAFLKAQDLRTVNNIVLIHLSDSNSNAVQFRNRIESETGKTVTVADRNMTIDFNLSPF